MFEESAAADGVKQSVSRTNQFGAENPADMGFLRLVLIGVAVIRGSEGRKVMLTFKDPGGFPHRVFVQGKRVMVHVTPLERRTNRCAEQSVLVGLRNGIEPGVKGVAG